MKKQFRSTFWSIETGNEWVQSYFQGTRDEIKKNAVEFNKAKWKAIEPQVKEWVGEGWMRWERDKPEWFNDNWKARVPVDWVPKEGKAGHRKARERSVAERERKGSVLHASAKKLVNVMGGDGGDERPERKVWERRRDAEEEPSSAEAVRGGSRVQPVTR
jgi:transketolase